MENVMYYAGIVEDYYSSARPSYTRNGYEKNVLIDTETEKCIFVSGEVLPKDNELLYRCKTVGGRTFSTLKTPKPKKEGRSPAVTAANRIYTGEPHPTTRDGNKATFVYLPDILYNAFPMTVKVSNLDAFLTRCMQLHDRDCTPYEVLDMLDRSTTTDSPFGLPQDIVRLPYVNEDGTGQFVFRFLHFEELEPAVFERHGARICATFEFTGTEDEVPHGCESTGF